jgi:pimeloyl-ACP methyl ester carboxylesterase
MLLAQGQHPFSHYVGIAQVVHGVSGEQISFNRVVSLLNKQGANFKATVLRALYGRKTRLLILLYLILQRGVIIRREMALGSESAKINHQIKKSIRSALNLSRSLKFTLGFLSSIYKLWPEFTKIDARNSVARLTTPSYIFADTDDWICDAQLIEELYRNIPEGVASIYISKGLGHRPHWMDTANFVSALNNWLQIQTENLNGEFIAAA